MLIQFTSQNTFSTRFYELHFLVILPTSLWHQETPFTIQISTIYSAFH